MTHDEETLFPACTVRSIIVSQNRDEIQRHPLLRLLSTFTFILLILQHHGMSKHASKSVVKGRSRDARAVQKNLGQKGLYVYVWFFLTDLPQLV